MSYIYDYFDNKSHIVINSPKPEELNDSQDILVILIYEYPKLNPNYIRITNVRDNIAICVGDNINCIGRIDIKIKKSTKLLKGINNNASCWDYTIE